MTIHEFIEANRLHLETTKAGTRDSEAGGGKVHVYNCRIAQRGPGPDAKPAGGFQVEFSKGDGCRTAGGLLEWPKLPEVLECLAEDFRGLEDALETAEERDPFEEWAATYGFDPDSRKACRIFDKLRANADAFRAAFGEELYASLRGLAFAD